MNNFQQLLQLSRMVQSRMSDLQDRMEKETVSARSGGGMVEVTVDGRGAVRKVKLDPSAVDPDDVEMLEDLILAAVSEAQRRAGEKMDEQMKEAAGGLPLPADLTGLFGG